MTVFLAENIPARRQFRSPRREPVSGVTVLHTAESLLDDLGPDTGAENVARYMVTRDTPGSYHDLVDSDSVVYLVDYGDEAYQDGTGTNPHALSISFALRTSDWTRMAPAKREAFLRQGAAAYARQEAWKAVRGLPHTPLRRITRVQSDAKVPGFIGHGDRDPARRSDPGADFPWADFFNECRKATTPPPEDGEMTNEDRMIRNQQHDQVLSHLAADRVTATSTERIVADIRRQGVEQTALLTEIRDLLKRGES